MDPLDRLVRESEAKDITGLSRTSRWHLERAGTFPKRRVIAGQVTGYLLSELIDWVRSRPISSYRAPEAALAARRRTLRRAA